MMKTTLLVTALLFSNLLFSATYKNPEKGFSFDFNETEWEVVPNAKKDQAAEVDKAMVEKTLVTLQRKTADEKYKARFNVVLDTLSKAKGKEKEPLDRYQKYAVDFLKSQRFTIVSANAGDITAYQRDFGLTFKQKILLKGDEVYLLTASTRTTKFDSYAKEIEKIFGSFHF